MNHKRSGRSRWNRACTCGSKQAKRVRTRRGLGKSIGSKGAQLRLAMRWREAA